MSKYFNFEYQNTAGAISYFLNNKDQVLTRWTRNELESERLMVDVVDLQLKYLNARTLICENVR